MIRLDDNALKLIDLALSEDRGPGDWTTRWIVSARARGEGRDRPAMGALSRGTADTITLPPRSVPYGPVVSRTFGYTARLMHLPAPPAYG